MDAATPPPDHRSFARARPPARWVKQWVPQDLVVTGGKCFLYRWIREDELAALNEKYKEDEESSEPAKEVLFLCSYDGCGKTFIDVGALKKHAHVHGEKQYVCSFEGCGKKFLDSSKLKRHFLIHTGEKNFVCPYEGCGKAFSLDFNLKAHMKTHLPENYHACPYQGCGRRFTQDCKLKAHVKQQHEKIARTTLTSRAAAPSDNFRAAPKPAAAASSQVASANRPFVCPYKTCGKAYIHEYKLNLHLRKEHPDHCYDDDNHTNAGPPKSTAPAKSSSQRAKPSLTWKMPPAKAPKRKGSDFPASIANAVETQWPQRDAFEDDSEETEEDGDGGEERWPYADASGGDDDDEGTDDE